MARPWKHLVTTPIADHRIFRLRTDRCESPRTGMAYDFVVLEAPDWVNVIALTEDDQVVLIRQYRFGTQTVCLEIPGGMVDEGESPLAAAKRELFEETGYQGEEWISLGSIEPNPAIQTNRCHTYLVRSCSRASEEPLHQEEKEDIQVELRPLSEVPTLLRSGQITHALVAVAFQKLSLYK